MQNACSVEEAKKNPLTNEDWLSLYGSLKITYPFFMDGLEQQLPGLTEEERHFLLFVEVRGWTTSNWQSFWIYNLLRSIAGVIGSVKRGNLKIHKQH